MQMSTEDMVAAIDRKARTDAAEWLDSMRSMPSAATIAAVAEEYAEDQFPEQFADAETPACRSMYELVFRSAATPAGQWSFGEEREQEEMLWLNG